jgi:soluble lytic murein transglycosylase-like protein
MRPAGSTPGSQRTTQNQNAFAQALQRAQSQNLAMRGAASTTGLGSLPGLPIGEQSGLPFDLQALAQQATPLPPGALPNGALPTGSPLTAAATAAAAAAPQVAAAATRPAGIQVPGGFGPLIQEAAQKYGVDPALIAAVMETESRFKPDAVSHAGAKGLMQLMPATARGLGVTDPLDPRQAILGGAKLLGILSEKYKGDMKLTLAAYNAGSGAVDKHGGIPPYAETQKYVPLVLTAFEKFKAQFGAPAQATPGTGR